MGRKEEVSKKKIYAMTAPPISSMTWGENVMAFIEAAIIGAAFAQLSRWYGIPNDIVTGTVDSKIPKGQTSYEKVTVTLLCGLAGANSMTHFGRLIDFAATQSLE